MRNTVLRFFAAFAVVLALGGCAGVMAGWEGIRRFDTLSDADFRQIKAGMTQPEVEKRVGKPLWRMSFPGRGEETWSYDYLDVQNRMRSVMHFDTRGVLKADATREFDADYYSAVSF